MTQEPKPRKPRTPRKKPATTAPPVETPGAPVPPDPPDPPPVAVAAEEPSLETGARSASAGEIIDGRDVAAVAREVVDLTVAYSPVIFFPSGKWRTDLADFMACEAYFMACEAYPLHGGKYRVDIPRLRYAGQSHDVTADELRVMRARWLLRNGEIRRAWNTLPPALRSGLVQFFYRGHEPYVAPAGSPLDDLAQGKVPMISIPIPAGDGRVDFGAVFEALARPGAMVPKACPAPLEGPRLPPPPGPEPPKRAVIKGEHGAECQFSNVMDASLLDVEDLPDDFKLCASHWERVRRVQGGAFKNDPRGLRKSARRFDRDRYTKGT